MLTNATIISGGIGRGASALALMKGSPGRAALQVVGTSYAHAAMNLARLVRLERRIARAEVCHCNRSLRCIHSVCVRYVHHLVSMRTMIVRRHCLELVLEA